MPVTPRSIYQEIVENAMVATGARFVHINHLDPASGDVRMGAFAGLHNSLVQKALDAIRQIFPTFDPLRVSLKADTNAWNQAVYLEGRAVSAPFHEIAAGVVHPRIIQLSQAIMGVRETFTCPLTVEGRVWGSISFHTGQVLGEAHRRTCEAFARQASLTLENARLLEILRDQVRELEESRRAITAREEALRRELAEMLHGRVQTRLLVAWHRLGQSLQLMESDPGRARDVLQRVRDEIDQIREQDVREVSRLLHPSIIRVGLLPAVRSLVARFEEHFRIDVAVDEAVTRLDGHESGLPESLRLVAYRVLEEALSNAYRHAKATRIDVSLALERGDTLTLTVRDDGCGFAAGDVQPGLGTTAMAARVGQAGGTWRIASAVGEGTTVFMSLPLEPAAGQRRRAPGQSPPGQR